MFSLVRSCYLFTSLGLAFPCPELFPLLPSCVTVSLWLCQKVSSLKWRLELLPSSFSSASVRLHTTGFQPPSQSHICCCQSLTSLFTSSWQQCATHCWISSVLLWVSCLSLSSNFTLPSEQKDLLSRLLL